MSQTLYGTAIYDMQETRRCAWFGVLAMDRDHVPAFNKALNQLLESFGLARSSLLQWQDVCTSTAPLFHQVLMLLQTYQASFYWTSTESLEPRDLNQAFRRLWKAPEQPVSIVMDEFRIPTVNPNYLFFSRQSASLVKGCSLQKARRPLKTSHPLQVADLLLRLVRAMETSVWYQMPQEAFIRFFLDRTSFCRNAISCSIPNFSTRYIVRPVWNIHFAASGMQTIQTGPAAHEKEFSL